MIKLSDCLSVHMICSVANNKKKTNRQSFVILKLDQ